MYMLRHQAGGILTDLIFAEPPTDQQMAESRILCVQRFGEKAKSGEPFWLQVIEVSVLGPEEKVGLGELTPPVTVLDAGSRVRVSRNLVGLTAPKVTARGTVR